MLAISVSNMRMKSVKKITNFRTEVICPANCNKNIFIIAKKKKPLQPNMNDFGSRGRVTRVMQNFFAHLIQKKFN